MYKQKLGPTYLNAFYKYIFHKHKASHPKYTQSYFNTTVSSFHKMTRTLNFMHICPILILSFCFSSMKSLTRQLILN